MSWTTVNYGYWEFWAPIDPANGFFGEHICSFDGDNKLIYINPEISTVDVRTDLYSDWKEWVQVRENSKYLPAIRATGGDPVGSGLYAGDIYFLINGWRVVITHDIVMTGVLYSDDYPSPFIIQPGGGVRSVVSNLVLAYDSTGGSGASAYEVWNYPIRTLTATPTYNGPTAVQIRQEIDTNSTRLQAIQTTVNAIDPPTAIEIADQVRVELGPEITHLMALQNGLTSNQATMLLEIYKLYGLDPTAPLVVTDTSRIAGTVQQTIASNQSQTVVTRVP